MWEMEKSPMATEDCIRQSEFSYCGCICTGIACHVGVYLRSMETFLNCAYVAVVVAAFRQVA